VLEGLDATPPLLGYVATTTKPLAATLLRIGPDRDPLLATWQLGLGRSTAWTSDAEARWSQLWVSWDGYADFWSNVVRDTFATAAGTSSVSARVRDGQLQITVADEGPFADGATTSVRVTGPDLQPIDVTLTRTGPNEFTGEIPVSDAGTYAVGAQVLGPDGTTLSAGTALATLSYAPEFEPGEPDEAALGRLAEATGGRANIEPNQAFDRADLRAGRARTELAPWLVLAACLLWPLAVALSRLNVRGAAIHHAGAVAWWRLRTLLPARPGREAATPAPPKPVRERPTKEPEPKVEVPSTLGTLLDRKRGTRDH
jgi:hypothetical protein